MDYTLGTFGSTYCYYQHSSSIGQNGTGAYMADSQRSNAINTRSWKKYILD